MKEFLQAFLMMSVQGAVLTAALLVLRAAFRKRMAPGVLYALWLIPTARLLIPGSVASVFSFQNLYSPAAVQMTKIQLHSAAAANIPNITRNVSDFTNNVSTILPEPVETAAASGAASPGMVVLAFAVWFAGVLAVLLFAAWKNLTFIKRAKKDAVLLETDCPLPVYLSEYVSSPCLCGIFRPVILVNDETLQSDAYLNLALRHELEHYRALDRFWALLRLVCCAVHWFNPLVWIAAKASVQDCERACDARVLKNADQEERETYGTLLLSYLKQPPMRYSLLCTSSPMGGGKRSLRGRIALIAEKPVTKRAAVIALAVCVTLTCLVACTGRVSRKEAYQQLAELADQTEFVTFGMEGGIYLAISGKTLARYLDGVQWTAVEPAAEGDVLVAYQLMGTKGKDSTITLVRGSDGTPYAYVSLQNASGLQSDIVCYTISEQEAGWAWAMSQIDEPTTLRSTLPDDSEFVMVQSPSPDGAEHYLFYGKEESTPTVYDYGIVYTPVYHNLDALYPRMAETMLFVDKKLGFVSFGSEVINGLQPPHLYRTEDGGKNWERIELPMGDLTAANGYGSIHVESIAFTDSKNGEVTVRFYYDGAPLSSRFSTTDGGKTWLPVTTSLPMQPADASTVERTADPNDTKSAYLVQERISLSQFETTQLTVRGVTTKIQWSSADPTIASVDRNGLVRGESQGKTVVTASWDGQSFDCQVSVNNSAGTMMTLLLDTLSYDAESHSVSFTVPISCKEPENLLIQITGRQANEGDFISRQFLEGIQWEAGQRYTFEVGEESYAELHFSVLYAISGANYTADIDLTRLLHGEMLHPTYTISRT